MLFRYLLFVLACVSFVSCGSYQTLSIDVLVPAKHSFRPELKSVVIVDNSIPYRGEGVHKVKTMNSSFEIDTVWFDEYAKVTIQTLKEELQNRNFFDSVYLHPKPIKLDPRLLNRALNWVQVDSLCKLYNAEAVIAFEKNIYSTKIKVEKMYDGNLLGLMDAAGAVLWRGYDNLKHEQIYKETQRDTISWDALGGNIDYVATFLPGIRGSLKSLAEYQGAKAVDHISPYWKSELRGYYDSGNYQFMQAAEFVRKEQWGEAIKLWKYVFDHSDKKIKARAAYNLALVSEILSDYESSKYWLDEGATVLSQYKGQSAALDKSRIIKYSIYMNKRVKEVGALQKQVGGTE